MNHFFVFSLFWAGIYIWSTLLDECDGSGDRPSPDSSLLWMILGGKEEVEEVDGDGEEEGEGLEDNEEVAGGVREPGESLQREKKKMEPKETENGQKKKKKKMVKKWKMAIKNQKNKKK